jgi:ribA/ribD-fused uncharacterized protein
MLRGAQASIRNQWSPHAAKKKAEQMAAVGDGPFARLENWDEVKHDIMKSIIREKIRQHEFVQEKLLATGDRHIIEVSPVDSYWGWGPDRKGENHLGHIWMELREELKTVAGIKA